MPHAKASSIPLAAAVAAALFTASVHVHAYCRTSMCDHGSRARASCTPAEPDDCGTPLFWRRPCIGISLQKDGTQQIALAAVETVVQKAFDSWQQADCGGGPPGIKVLLAEPVSCDQVEYNQRGGNANIIMFRDDSWPHQGMGNTLALTTVTYSLDSAEIFDADMEVNSTPSTTLTVGDSGVQFDLQSIVTHEVGHVLGMAHSQFDNVTMAIEYIPHTTDIRVLSSDDEAAICDAYPPTDAAACDTTPRHGFKATCGPGPPDDGGDCECTSAHTSGRRHTHWAGLLVLGALLWVRRRPS